MIDEKKIEEAAKKHFDNIVLNTELYQGDIVGAFKAGINWFLGNLWHDASEEPDKDRTYSHILYEIDGGYDLNGFKTKMIPIGESWASFIKHEYITRWLYIEDLLKGGK